MASEYTEEVDDDHYHVDFTTVSGWEIFIARIEEVIQGWQIPAKRLYPAKMKLSNCVWEKKSEKLYYKHVDSNGRSHTDAEEEFVITRHYLKFNANDKIPSVSSEDSKSHLPRALEEISSSEMDFYPLIKLNNDETEPHIIARLYGLRDFIVLTPKRPIMNDSKIKQLLSSLFIASNNVGCDIPVFVRCLEFWQKFYMGVCEGRGIRGDFDMVHLEKVAPQCKYLSAGVVSLDDTVTVAARFSYFLNDFTIFTWPGESVDSTQESFMNVPFGPRLEPITSLSLHTCWPEIVESAAGVETETFCDFDPFTAPVWSISITKADKLMCQLTDYLFDFVNYAISDSTREDLLGDVKGRDAGDFEQPLRLLTDGGSLSNILTDHGPMKKLLGFSSSDDGPIDRELLYSIIYYLFPDTTTETKTCQVDSLVWRLAIVMAHVLYKEGGPRSAAYLWHKFCEEIRFRWNVSKPNLIPGVAPGDPDPKTCLLHQKLQMINCCIERRLKRLEQSHDNENKIKDKDDDDKFYEIGDESDEEEFFDCDDDVKDEDSGRKASLRDPGIGVGRRELFEDLTLLKTGQPMYVPLTQDPPLKTEDQLEADDEALIQLGSDPEGSQLRAEMMSASLLSDMEAFKAANPGSIIEDFIRWYSPVDWIEDDSENKGHLSTRMMIPGNRWLTLWESARQIPAKRQKRLFDEVSEGEKALHMLESCNPGASALLLLPVLSQAAVQKLTEESESIPLPFLHSAIAQINRKIETITRHTANDTKRYQDFFLEIGQAESLISQIKSIEYKICCEGVDSSLACRIATEPEVILPGGPEALTATRVKLLFKEALRPAEFPSVSQESQHMQILKDPYEKEFILRLLSPRPQKKLSRLCPQRLFAKITKSSLTMAGCFSQDTTFF